MYDDLSRCFISDAFSTNLIFPFKPMMGKWAIANFYTVTWSYVGNLSISMDSQNFLMLCNMVHTSVMALFCHQERKRRQQFSAIDPWTNTITRFSGWKKNEAGC